MRAADLPSPTRAAAWPSPLPPLLAALALLLVVRLVGLSPSTEVPFGADADIAPARQQVSSAALAEIAPASGPAPAVVEAGLDLEALVAPAAGALGLAGEPLEPEPFLEERRELARQQEALAVRQVALEVAEARLREHVTRLEELKAELDGLVRNLTEEDEARLTQLVELYEKMKPKQAAAIFDALAFEVLVPLTLQMSETKLAPILGAMDTDVARRLTGELSGRRRSVVLQRAEATLR